MHRMERHMRLFVLHTLRISTCTGPSESGVSVTGTQVLTTELASEEASWQEGGGMVWKVRARVRV